MLRDPQYGHAAQATAKMANDRLGQSRRRDAYYEILWIVKAAMVKAQEDTHAVKNTTE
jgi:hypothetical protein